MKRLLMASLFVLTLVATSAFAEEMTGYFTCSKCKHTLASGAAACAKQCIKSGVAPIFVTEAGTTYKIANPAKVGDMILEKVTVDGTVKNGTVTIESVKSAS
jgi:hypothetical protein